MNLKQKALEFATMAHEGQTRKGTGKPMIGHPINVANILEKAGFPVEVVAAGFLHDVVEDTKYTMDDIVQLFGLEVARVVAGNTEDKEKTWEERKEHTIDWIKEAPLDVRALIVADKFDNLKALVADHERLGESVWSLFKRGKEFQKWYFSSVAANMLVDIGDVEVPEFFFEYQELVHSFFGNE